MRPLPAFLGCVLLSACGASPPAASPPGPVASAAPPAPATSATTIPAPPKPSPPVLALEAERRAVLDELVAFDTSHGNEIGALRPIARRFEDIGLHADLFEALPGRGDLVVRLKGSGAKKPLLLLAHIDVVPVEGQPWTVPPFATTEKDGFLYGRGVNDDKGMAAAFVAIALDLARSHAALSRDVIVALTAGEETDGIGVRWLLEHRRDLIDAEVALNEGGSVITSADFSRVEAVEVSAAEKVFQSYRLVVKGPGGHSSIPPTDVDPVGILGRALVRVAALRFSPRALPPVKEALAMYAKREKEPTRGALERTAANAPRVTPADGEILAKDRFYNALVRTTCVTTMLQASPQANVLPTTAEAIVNCRILPDETPAQVKAMLDRTVADPAVIVKLEADDGVGPLLRIDAPVMDAVRGAAARWPG